MTPSRDGRERAPHAGVDLDGPTPWRAERQVDSALAARLVREQFPALEVRSVEVLGEGWDNAAFLVDGAWVFRFPRRALAVTLIECEARLLPMLAARLPVAVPVPELLGQPSAAFPWPFAGYRWLPGRSACDPSLDDAARLDLAAPLGTFLRALHACDVEQAAAGGAPLDTLGRLDVALQGRRAARRLRRLLAGPHAASARLGQRALVAARAVQPRAARHASASPLRVVHGDLYARHLLVDAAGSLVGVIDWGDLHLGDPAVDLALAFNFLPPVARPTFAEAYGAVSADTWARARFRATCHSIGALDYAFDAHDQALMSAAHRALSWLASE
jgi:aminoglycoside phosphotransferase (APT) family kinase protein